MAKRTFLAGATGQTIDLFIQDSSSTIGAGLPGLAWNTGSLTAYYRKGATGTPTAITLATQTVGGAWSSGGFVELDATHMKGAYRLDVPDTVFASAPYATVYLYGAANMAPVIAELEIVAYNPFDGVRLGLMALPNAAANAAGGLPVSIAGALDLDEMNADVEAIPSFPSNFSLLSIDGSGALTLTSEERDSVADALLDRANGVETSLTLRQWLRGAFAALLGKASGLSPTGGTAKFRDQADSKDVISATVDGSGNRSAVTLDLS